MVVAIGNNGVKEGAKSGGIGSSCSNNTWVIDSIATDCAADAASDFISYVIVLLFWLWIIISDVSKAVSRAITT